LEELSDEEGFSDKVGDWTSFLKLDSYKTGVGQTVLSDRSFPSHHSYCHCPCPICLPVGFLFKLRNAWEICCSWVWGGEDYFVHIWELADSMRFFVDWAEIAPWVLNLLEN
jgi:hypothetical protein